MDSITEAALSIPHLSRPTQILFLGNQTGANSWKYYLNLDIENPFENENAAESFIHEYFKTGGKVRVLEERIPFHKARNIHSISAFFLGIFLKPIFNINESEMKPDFRYLWFITCLYHDYGYYIEEKKEKYPPNRFSLNAILKEWKVEYDLLKKINTASFYSSSIIKQYYKYCQTERCFINHGIVGGLMLYDRLMKNYETNKREAKELKISGAINDDFCHNNLHWSKDHYEYYLRTASSIIHHNIWFANDKTEELYRKYKLNGLIIDISGKLKKCSDDPFLFLLLLSDTIEPIKEFTNLEPKCVLEKIDISVNCDERKIKISVIDQCINFHHWFCKIKEMKTWLDLKVDINKNELTITIN